MKDLNSLIERLRSFNITTADGTMPWCIEAADAIENLREEILTRTLKDIPRHRLIGEMAGALTVCNMVLKQEDINKKGLEDILERYRKEFGE